MSGRDRQLADRLRAGDPLRLLLVKPGAPAEVEAAGHAGFDGVILDAEHGAAGPPELEHHLRAADAARVPALVRLPANDPAWAQAALDAGAAGIVVPHVLDPAGARAAVAAAHYPPRGSRGLALTTRAGGLGTASVSGHLARAAAQTLVVIQIEDAEALSRLEAILAVDGVDAVLIGATDLSASLGHPGEVRHPAVREAIDAILTAARAAGIAVATVVATSAQAAAWQGTGGKVAVFVSTALVRDAFAEAAGRGSAAGAATANATGRNGTPPAVVLLPGMLGSAGLWDEVARGLLVSLSVRVARIDLDDSIVEMATGVLASAPARFVLVGHSLGAIVALEVQRQAPARVAGLVLVCASGRAASEAQLAAWRDTEERARAVGFPAFAEEFARANLGPDRLADAGLLARVSSLALDVGPRGLARQLAAQRTRPDSLPLLGSIRCPALVVSATGDTVCPPELQEELAAGIPGARLERLAGCDHMAPLEAPAELAELIGRFAREWA